MIFKERFKSKLMKGISVLEVEHCKINIKNSIKREIYHLQEA